jgi:hypothetical protein
MICLQNKILYSQPIRSLVAGIEWKVLYRFRSAVMFLFHILLKIILAQVEYFRDLIPYGIWLSGINWR